MKKFATVLLSEALFYDEEYGATGYVSLVDEDAEIERFIAAFHPEERAFGIDEAVEWEEEVEFDDEDESEDPMPIGYRLATGSKRRASFSTPVEAAEYLIALATRHDLQPSLTLLFEDDLA